MAKSDALMTVAGVWDIRVISGVERVSAREIARRLGYNPRRPTTLNEKLRNDKNLKDIDVTHERASRKVGIARRQWTESWVTLPDALLVALHLRTKVSNEVRLSVVEHLESLVRQRALVLPAATRRDQALLTAVTNGFDRLARLLLQPKEESNLVAADQVALLHARARAVSEAETGKAEVARVWREIQHARGLNKTRLMFSSVARCEFEDIYAGLLERLKRARSTTVTPPSRPRLRVVE